MIRSLLSILHCVILCFTAACAAAAAASPASGDWQGILAGPQGNLTIIVQIAENDGVPAGVMEVVEQPGSDDIPLKITEAGPKRLTFDVPAIGGGFTGEWDSGREAWSGTWSQAGFRLPLVLQKESSTAEVIAGLDGFWEGGVSREGRTLRLILRVTTVDGRTSARFDAPDGGANDLKVRDFARQGDRVGFVIPRIGARFDGTLAAGGDRLNGDWFFPGRPEAKVEFVRTRASAKLTPRRRPQMPTTPLPYGVEEVRFDSPGASEVRLAGTLTLPAGKGPFAAAVLVTGSGPQDRDETLFEHKPFAVLADHLTRHGIAVLRYDDRGIASSTGNFNTATTRDFVADANAAVAYLATRADIDSAAIGLIGHSEGGVIGEIAASEKSQIDYLVLLAAPAIDMRQLALAQRRLLGADAGVSQRELDRTDPIFAKIYDTAAAADSDEQARQRVAALLTPETVIALGMPESNRELLVQQMTGRWYRELLQIDPSIYLSKIRIPVLAMNGSLDRLVVAESNLRAMREFLRDNPDATVQELPGLNHMFQNAKSGGLGEPLEIEETFAPTALAMVSIWIRQRFVSRADTD